MRRVAFFAFAVATALLFVTVGLAQQPVLKLTATSVNVSEPGIPVRIDIFRLSTEQERNQLVTALTPPLPPPAPVVAEVPLPPAPAEPTAGAEAAPARGGRGGARGNAGAARGGGGRGGGRGGGNNAAAPVDPISALTTAIGRAPTIGYIWTNEVTGYALKLAWRIPSPDGAERIILATNRRIGANTLSWTPVKGTPTPYQFTLLEMRLPSRSPGEAKASLTANIAIDNEAKTIALESYAAAPTLLESVKRSSTQD